MSETGSLKSRSEHWAGSEPAPATVERRIDGVVTVYFLLTAAIIWFYRDRLPSWDLLLTGHLVAATVIWMLHRVDFSRLPVH
jgi:hypothetical protein